MSKNVFCVSMRTQENLGIVTQAYKSSTKGVNDGRTVLLDNCETLSQGNKAKNDRARHLNSFSGLCICAQVCIHHTGA